MESLTYIKDPETGIFYDPDHPSDVSYSDDPAFEARLLEIISAAGDLSVGSAELERHISDWPSLYHLTSSRGNLLRPIEQMLKGRVLEMGAGCGAITRYLGETGAEVTAVEGSMHRARVAAQRCRDLPNVAVVVDNLFHFSSDRLFDVIVCVGVLEYSNLYSCQPDNLGAALARLRMLLCDSGILVIAIKNQLGLKYLAGAPEDHASQPYCGVCDLYRPAGPLTLGRLDWIRRLDRSGFPHKEFFYAFPDYKCPSLLIHESALKDMDPRFASIVRSEAINRAIAYRPSFSEEMAWSVVARNGLVEDLANSFLILAGRRCPEFRPFAGKLLWKYGTNRLREFCKELVVERTGKGGLWTRTRRVFPNAPAQRGGYRHVVTDGPLLEGTIYADALYDIVNRSGWTIDQVRAWAEAWLRLLSQHLQGIDNAFLPPNFIDCIPKNIVATSDGSLVPFDLEYVAASPVPADYVRFRGIFHSFRSLGSCSPPHPEVPLNLVGLTLRVLQSAGYDFSEDRVADCLKREAGFMEAVRGIPAAQTETALRESKLNVLTGTPPATSARRDARLLHCQVYWRDSETDYSERSSTAEAAQADGQARQLLLIIPPFSSRGEIRLRIDFSDRPVLMRLDALRLLDAAGLALWEWDGDVHSLRSLPHKDTVFFRSPAGKTGALLLLESDDATLELPTEAFFGPRLATGGRISIEGALSPPVEFLLKSNEELAAQVERSTESAEMIAEHAELLKTTLNGLIHLVQNSENRHAQSAAAIEDVRHEIRGLEARVVGGIESVELAGKTLERLQAAVSDLTGVAEVSENRHAQSAAAIDDVRHEIRALETRIVERLGQVQQPEARLRESLLADITAANAVLLRQLAQLGGALERQEVALGDARDRGAETMRALQDILNSRIWRSLCTAGEPVLQLQAAGRRMRQHVARAMTRRSKSVLEEARLVCDDPLPEDPTPRSGSVRIRGWAAATHEVVEVQVRVADGPLMPARMGEPRPDVGKAFPSLPGASRAGWSLDLDTLQLPTGTYPILIAAKTKTGHALRTHTSLVVDHQRAYASDYDRWMEEFERRDADSVRSRLGEFQYRPTISVLMPVYRCQVDMLRLAIESVRRQSYVEWELCIVDDSSGCEDIETLLRSYAERDRRIRFSQHGQNLGISAATNTALGMARGDFIALLDDDDEYSEDALFHMVDALQDERKADLIYSDEDKIDEHGKRYDPFFKPDWSPDLLLSENYICHLLMFRRSLAEQVGGCRTEFDGSQDHDLTLRLSTVSQRIVHVPRILYHWRSLPSSTARSQSNKEHAWDAGRRAIQDHLNRTSPGAAVQPGLDPARWRVVYPIAPPPPRVTIIIPSGGDVEVLEANLMSLVGKTSYPNYEILIADNSSHQLIEKLARQWKRKVALRSFDWRNKPFRYWKRRKAVRYFDWRNKPFNYSVINNRAAEQCNSPILLFLNDDTSVIGPDWLTAMVEQAMRPEVGAVGARLLYPDDRIQHAGVILGVFDNCGHAFKGLDGRRSHYFSFSDVIRNVSAVTGACLMIRAEIFRAVGGFDETEFAVAFNDIDLCLRIGAQGYRIIYTPHAQLYHHEAFSKTLKDLIPKGSEVAAMRARWKDLINADPFYNPNLTRTDEDYSLLRR